MIRYDHRDSGESSTSPPGAPSYTGADLAADPLRILDALGVELTELTKGQAEYLGVDVAGPYKSDHYRY